MSNDAASHWISDAEQPHDRLDDRPDDRQYHEQLTGTVPVINVMADAAVGIDADLDMPSISRSDRGHELSRALICQRR